MRDELEDNEVLLRKLSQQMEERDTKIQEQKTEIETWRSRWKDLTESRSIPELLSKMRVLYMKQKARRQGIGVTPGKGGKSRRRSDSLRWEDIEV